MKINTILFILFTGSLYAECNSRTPCVPFIRGDANFDGKVNLSDIKELSLCIEGAVCGPEVDVNNDGKVNNLDIVYLLSFLFGSGDGIDDPYPNPCFVKGSCCCCLPEKPMETRSAIQRLRNDSNVQSWETDCSTDNVLNKFVYLCARNTFECSKIPTQNIYDVSFGYNNTAPISIKLLDSVLLTGIISFYSSGSPSGVCLPCQSSGMMNVLRVDTTNAHIIVELTQTTPPWNRTYIKRFLNGFQHEGLCFHDNGRVTGFCQMFGRISGTRFIFFRVMGMEVADEICTKYNMNVCDKVYVSSLQVHNIKLVFVGHDDNMVDLSQNEQLKCAVEMEELKWEVCE